MCVGANVPRSYIARACVTHLVLIHVQRVQRLIETCTAIMRSSCDNGLIGFVYRRCVNDTTTSIQTCSVTVEYRQYFQLKLGIPNRSWFSLAKNYLSIYFYLVTLCNALFSYKRTSK